MQVNAIKRKRIRVGVGWIVYWLVGWACSMVGWLGLFHGWLAGLV